MTTFAHAQAEVFEPATHEEALALSPIEAVRAFSAWVRERRSGAAALAVDLSDESITQILRDGIAIRKETANG